ncbi:BBP7 family outer membrane beta-barrel protein [Aeoliella mucimassa]|uniref:Uncharacterized protein n=1 Tax=Aeoliella mucimassa TaxID=2527972 RepID=A0A518ASC1_9BACT|nr:BBP7 family outer membrane beta-barrel protein [Aeoliella mucimassa]QDU57620.1 hypothetical protein Pan181_38390 [Aeoliella mucimassa]
MADPSLIESVPPGEELVGPSPSVEDSIITEEGVGAPSTYGSYADLNDSVNMWGCRPAITESTGTWLRRGWWYTEIDAVVLNRMWKRDDVEFGSDSASTKGLHVERSDPGAGGNVRFTLGRFLFRDMKNRDHTVEFSAFGGSDFSQSDTLTSSTGGQTLFVPTSISHFNTAFDGAESMSIYYDSSLSSFEVNYLVKERMGRDRMMLNPNGEWVRRANKGVTRQFIAGLRYVDLEEHLDWTADNISSLNNEDGSYNIYTNNDLFGMQIGGSMLFENDRWNVEILGKGGPFLNDAKARSRMTVTDATATSGISADNSYLVENRESSLAFVGEFRLVARYHLRPNLSLRAGWQMMYITSVATAPDQANFSPDEGRFPYTGDPFYNGAIFGFESYW